MIVLQVSTRDDFHVIQMVHTTKLGGQILGLREQLNLVSILFFKIKLI